MKIAIIIVNYNGGPKIVKCLQSLRSTIGSEAEIVVVDNASSDDSVAKIKNKDLKILKNKKNLGFAAGANIGVKYVLRQGIEAILLLNPDTLVDKNFLESLLKNHADIVVPVIKFKKDNHLVYDFGGKINWWLGRCSHFEFSNCQIVQLPNLDYVSGCCMLIKRRVFEKIGMLDERYFLYFEDVDFCLRARKAGFKISVEPKSFIFHKLSTTEKKPLTQNLQLLKSNLVFIRRHIAFWKKPIAYIYWLLLAVKILLT